jgi:hypothetical protein
VQEKLSLLLYESSLRSVKSKPEMANEVIGGSWVTMVRICLKDIGESLSVRLENVSTHEMKWYASVKGFSHGEGNVPCLHDLYPLKDRSPQSPNQG